MRKVILYFAIFAAIFPKINAQDTYSVELARSFTKDIFEANGVSYLKPLVESVNATSNSRFFNQAYVPESVEQPYFRFGLHTMVGFVPNDMKTYKPILPSKEYDLLTASQYMKVSYFDSKWNVSIIDTSGLIHYFFLTICAEGLKQNSFKLPNSASTILGSSKIDTIPMPQSVLRDLVDNHPIFDEPLWNLMPAATKDSLQNSIKNAIFPHIETIPPNFFLPQGGNINTIFAGIPQFEIGSFMGTEALIRFIPTINLGSTIGDFSFWGFGLKHSISQYFSERFFDLAIQVVYQGTKLHNKVGVTNSEINANAAMWNLNVHASKSIEDWFDVYSGFSYEKINISTSFKYYLSAELQWKLGLLEDPYYVPTPGFPGDQNPQTVSIDIQDNNFKWVAGISRQFGPVAAFIDFSISRLYILSGGIELRL